MTEQRDPETQPQTLPEAPAETLAETLTVSRGSLIVGGSDLAFREMLHNLLAFSVRLEQIRGRFAAHIGLTGPQYTILITIRQLQALGDVGVGRVAEHLALTPTFVTTETKKLVKLGVLEKQPDPQDLRRVKLRVTPLGEARLRDLAPVQREINDQLFEPVTPENFQVLHDLAAELRHSAERALLLSDYLSRDEEKSA
ncbi:MarR family winged helix-turn-helix transcriptional regulator [Pseudodonghicola flavimaris]|uniref:MarR family winged helix-turn-helix transcriptional regulator n=1 Tax=Pseudodonghicola flavimaris TaxID=3050036 RepID=A0ABT7F2M5_9RHOB|nr:MarR family winged helix-turn-helix transcriptional regulator [Pseudodonghicola flavimaris]MDK3018864.1 MarR family winged helix-turn-helix transcriptional regulator [Pseudodonghicola flavimaris]